MTTNLRKLCERAAKVFGSPQNHTSAQIASMVDELEAAGRGESWISVDDGKPSRGDRVLLAIRYEDCPVVGYWGAGRWEACTVNHEVNCGPYCYGGMADGNFKSAEVTHWQPLPLPPKEPTND